ncbi:hypothetical protein [Streptomyces spongiae]|uniref:Uncharacterized protein n=1 Tax=Streptomyces spongiae TaxID=565072 RepID=A0A5N8XXM1_9ACTN|nr:hypothetical protein [Streptomyces spongiae]MPY64006.1 hypothetical protein [Streptomyces spongiae]
MPSRPFWVTMAKKASKVRSRTVMGGVMRLGKALATGVAEEQDQPYEEELRLPEEAEEPATAAAEEVPVAR